MILSATLVSETAALDHLHGTRAVVRSQPATGRPRALWNVLAQFVFLLAGRVPALVGIAARSPVAAFTFVTALVFVAAFSVSAGTITRGGKFFLAAYTLLWYAAVSTGKLALDLVEMLRPAVPWSVATVHLALGAMLVAVALVVDRWRAEA